MPPPDRGAPAIPLPDKYNKETKQGRWQYKKILGEGAFGIVHDAIDVKTGQRVAVKVLRTEKMVDRLLASREVRCAQYFKDHTFPITGHRLFVNYLEDQTGLAEFPDEALYVWADRGKWKGQRLEDVLRKDAYIVMEHVDGVNVREMIKREKLSIADCGSILHQAAYAIKGLHDKNCIHRDFRVHNLMWNHGKLKVLDFGLVLMNCVNSSKVWNNPLVRTFWNADSYWMPPEVKRPNHSGKSWNFYPGASYSFDIYSFGVLVVELLLAPGPHKRMTRNKQSIEELGLTRLDPLKAIELLDKDQLNSTGIKSDILSRCLSLRGQDRPTPQTILQIKEKNYFVQSPVDLNSKLFTIFKSELNKIAGVHRTETNLHLITEMSRKIVDNSEYVSIFGDILLKFTSVPGVSVYRVLCIIDRVCRTAEKIKDRENASKISRAFAPLMSDFIKAAYDKYDPLNADKTPVIRGHNVDIHKVEQFIGNWIRARRFSSDELHSKVRDAPSLSLGGISQSKEEPCQPSPRYKRNKGANESPLSNCAHDADTHGDAAAARAAVAASFTDAVTVPALNNAGANAGLARRASDASSLSGSFSGSKLSEENSSPRGGRSAEVKLPNGNTLPLGESNGRLGMTGAKDPLSSGNNVGVMTADQNTLPPERGNAKVMVSDRNTPPPARTNAGVMMFDANTPPPARTIPGVVMCDGNTPPRSGPNTGRVMSDKTGLLESGYMAKKRASKNALLSSSDDDEAAHLGRERILEKLRKGPRQIDKDKTGLVVDTNTHGASIVSPEGAQKHRIRSSSSNSPSPTHKRLKRPTRSSSKNRTVDGRRTRSESRRESRRRERDGYKRPLRPPPTRSRWPSHIPLRSKSRKNNSTRRRRTRCVRSRSRSYRHTRTTSRSHKRHRSTSASAERARRFVIERNEKKRAEEEKQQLVQKQQEQQQQQQQQQQQPKTVPPRGFARKGGAKGGGKGSGKGSGKGLSGSGSLAKVPVASNLPSRWQAGASDVSSEESIQRRLGRKSKEQKSKDDNGSDDSSDSSSDSGSTGSSSTESF